MVSQNIDIKEKYKNDRQVSQKQGNIKPQTFRRQDNGDFRFSDIYPDIMYYPGYYPSFNPYSFFPVFAHYWDLYEREFIDLIERREKYEMFKELLRQEEHEYIHVNRPKEKYRAINHLMGTHNRIVGDLSVSTAGYDRNIHERFKYTNSNNLSRSMDSIPLRNSKFIHRRSNYPNNH